MRCWCHVPVVHKSNALDLPGLESPPGTGLSGRSQLPDLFTNNLLVVFHLVVPIDFVRHHPYTAELSANDKSLGRAINHYLGAWERVESLLRASSAAAARGFHTPSTRAMVSIDYLRSARSNAHQPLEDERPAKRISTPAGQRLSVILDSRRAKSPSATAKISVTTTSTYCNDPNHTHIDPVQHGHKTAKKAGVVSVLTGGLLGDAPRESCEAQSHNGSNLSVSVWSDKAAEKFVELRQRKRGGFASWSRRRIAIVIAIIVALIVALAVGLAVGLKKGTTSRYGCIACVEQARLTWQQRQYLLTSHYY